LAGMHWVYALAAAFVAMIFESTNPKRKDDEEPAKLTPVRFLTMVMGFITPAFLFLHAVASVMRGRADLVVFGGELEANMLRAVLLLAGAPVIVVALAASVIGLIIGAALPKLGRAMYAVAPVLTAATFAFTVWVTYSRALW